MKAPVEKYSDAQWQAIKDCLKDFGVDADEVMVTAPWWNRNATTEQPLRAALEELTQAYLASPKRRSPLQKAKDLSATLKEIEEFLSSRFDYRSLGITYISDEAQNAHEALTTLADKLRLKRDALKAEGSSSRFNASKERRNEYWAEVRQVWRQATRNSAKRPKVKDFDLFLRACAPKQFQPPKGSLKNLKRLKTVT